MIPSAYYFYLNTKMSVNFYFCIKCTFNIRIIYNNLRSEMSDFVPGLHVITGCDTTSYKFNGEMVQIFKKICKDPSSIIWINMLGMNITVTEKLSKRWKVFVQTITYNGKLNDFFRKPKSPVPFLPDPDSLVEKPKRVYLQCYVWLNAPNGTLPLFRSSRS